jgi:small subunit ribosomal protein S6
MSNVLPKHRAREYETIFILHPESGTAVIDKVASRCREVISRLEGKLLRAENWGNRRLAYPVKKNPKGIYIYLRYLGYQNMVHELERNLRMLDAVIKYLTVKVDEDVDPEARPVLEEEISFVPRHEEPEPPVAKTEEKAPEKEPEPKEPEPDVAKTEEKAPEKEPEPAVAKTEEKAPETKPEPKVEKAEKKDDDKPAEQDSADEDSK